MTGIYQNMINYINSKNFLFIEPCLSSQYFIHQARLKGYGTFIISENDIFLNLSKENIKAASAFFQLDTHNQEAVLNLVQQLSEKFKIDGVIPGNEDYGPLTANVAACLKKPGLKPEIECKIYRNELLEAVIKKENLSLSNMELNKDVPHQEYNVEGLIKNKTIHIFGIAEKLFFPERDNHYFDCIMQSEVDKLPEEHKKALLQKLRPADDNNGVREEV